MKMFRRMAGLILVFSFLLATSAFAATRASEQIRSYTNSPIRKKFQLFSLITFISRKSTYFTIVVKKFPYRSLLCYPSATFGTT